MYLSLAFRGAWAASCLIAGAGCPIASGEPDTHPTQAGAPAEVVEVPAPPAPSGSEPGYGIAPHPRRLALFDVEVGDSLDSVTERFQRSPTLVGRSTFEAVYDAAGYRDLGADIALALGFDFVAIFTDGEGALFRSYVSADRIRMMSFVGSTMNGHRFEGRLSSACRIDRGVETIESACGTGYVTLQNVGPDYPTTFHYFTRGFSVVVFDNRITELHLYGGLTRDEITRVEAALRNERR